MEADITLDDALNLSYTIVPMYLHMLLFLLMPITTAWVFLQLGCNCKAVAMKISKYLYNVAQKLSCFKVFEA